MEPLSFLAKLLGLTWRVGLAVAIMAFIVFAGRLAGIEPFVSLDRSSWGWIAVGGVLGFCIAFVEAARSAIVWLSRKVNPIISRRLELRPKRRNALKNFDAMTADQAKALLYLRKNNMNRFYTPCQNELLLQLRMADLITIDDPNIKLYSVSTYYRVPNYVWKAVEHHLGKLPVPATPPWLPTPEEERRRKQGLIW